MRIVVRVVVLLAALCVPQSLPAADMNKIVRHAFRVAETSFDPARESDRYSAFINEALFESLLTYDYLARPARV
jgi:ABC-type oligopeptide transport system substrate-binding subunit